jgi:hypothetical protein
LIAYGARWDRYSLLTSWFMAYLKQCQSEFHRTEAVCVKQLLNKEKLFAIF